MIFFTNSYDHTVSIHRTIGGIPVIVGSGVLLRIEGMNFIATAAHVAEALDSEVVIGRVKDNQIRGMGDRPKRFSAVKQKDGKYKDGLDLALVEVTRRYLDFIQSEEMNFFDLTRNGLSEPLGRCFVSGYPAKMNYFNNFERKWASSCMCYHIESFVESHLKCKRIGGNPDFHLAISMKKRNRFVDIQNKLIPELFDLHGMSGGGVWLINSEIEAMNPDQAIAFAGIFVEDRDTKMDRQGLAKVIKGDAIINLIKSPNFKQ
jgi:hypothetical protein